LTPKLMLWGVSCVNHPVEVIQVFCDSFHKHRALWPPNVQSSGTRDQMT
jgi:hypothetical protein